MSDETGSSDLPILDYHPPDPPKKGPPAAAVGGFILAVALQGCLAMGPYLSTRVPPPPHASSWPMLLVFAVLEVAAVAGVVLMSRRRPFGSWAYFLVGLLLGTGVTALVEGVCFITT